MPLTDPKLLSCAYVVLNKSVPTEADPQFSPTFCNTLFDSPQNTIVQAGAFGLEVVSPGKTATRRFVFHPAKIQIVTEDPPSLMRTAGRVLEQLSKSTFQLDPSSYGLNYEFDFKLDEGDAPASEWLAKRFFSPESQDLGGAKAKLAKAEILLEGFDSLKGLNFASRVGAEDRVFVYTNLHHEGGPLFQGEQLEHAVSQGYEKCLGLVSKLLKK